MSVAFVMAMVGFILMAGLSLTGSAIGVVIGGSAVIGALKKKPEVFGTTLVLSSMPATQGLYGFVAFILYNGNVVELGKSISIFQGLVVLAAGAVVGLVCLISAITQGRVVAHGIVATGDGHNVFANTLILGAFPEFYAILSLVTAIMMMGLLKI